jgi:hypothetical protein
MRCAPVLSRVAVLALIALASVPPAPAQEAAYPPISAHLFTNGSIDVRVTGSQNIDEEIPINSQASIGDGEITWLQYGASGSESPNSLITYTQTGEVGVSVGKGKFIVTAGVTPGEKPQCEGKTEVAPTLITGKYTCRGVTSYDAATGTMGKVDVVVAFTAKS